MQSVYKAGGRLEDWKELIQQLRFQHKANRRLMQELDNLESRKRLLDQPGCCIARAWNIPAQAYPPAHRQKLLQAAEKAMPYTEPEKTGK